MRIVRPVLVRVFLATVCIAAHGAHTALAKPRDALLDEALRFSRDFDPSTDVEACRAALAKLEQVIRTDLAAAREGREEPLPARAIIAILNRRILLERKVSYLSNRYWRDSLFTAALLRKSGNCVSTSLLYYLLGRRLDLPIRLAVAPEHVFVRWEDGERGLNIETTAKGSLVGKAELLRRFELRPSDLGEHGFLRGLTEVEARAQLLSIWASTFARLDKDERALALLERALALWPDNKMLQLRRAGQLLDMGRIAEARASVKTVSTGARSPYGLTYAALLSSRIHERTRDFDAAIHVARMGMRWAGRRQLSHLTAELGRLYRHKRQFDRAIAYHQMTADLRYDADAFNSLGSALTEAHRDREAIQAYETAVRLNPEDFFPQLILAGLFERTGDKAKGRALFKRIQRPRGRTLEWLSALVWYHAVTGDEEKMLENMAKALAIDPSSGTWNYYKREPDLDPYRKKPGFVELMERHQPK